MVSAGRILIMPRGAYDNNAPYEILDLVSYNGSSYVAKGPTKGNLPTDTTYWQLSAYGGNAANVAGNFAVIETTSVATVQHLERTLFVDENSQFMKATQTINIGDSIVSGTNCTPTTVEQLINEVTAYVDGLDSRNRKLHGVTEIAAQTDLHGLALGEYYKDKTTFYVTNAPAGIANVPSAVFRLTVEAGSKDASLATSPILLTLRTLDGKTYTQGFDGNNWGAWIEAADQASTNNAISAVAASVEATQDSIAPVESATATSAHLEGSQLYYNDVLYDVTANISIGDVLADGVNIQAASESITEHFSSQIQTLTNNVSYVSQKVSNSSDLFDSTKAYSVGDLCIYDNTLYRCITACSAASWSVNSSCFEAITLVDAINDDNKTSALSVTVNTDYIDSSNATINAVKSGKVLVITGYFHTTADVSLSTSPLLFTVNGCKLFNNKNARIIACQMGADNKSKYLTVDQSGNNIAVTGGQYQGTLSAGYWNFTGTVIVE